MPKKPAIKTKDIDQATSHARSVLDQVLGRSRTPASPKLRMVKAKKRAKR